MNETPSGAAGASLIRTAAAFVIVVAGIKAAADVILPLLVAAFLAMICVVPARKLRQRGVPAGVATALVLMALVVILLVVSGIAARSVRDFAANVDQYQPRVREVLDAVAGWLTEHGVKVDAKPLADAVNPGALLRLVASTAESTLATLGNLVVILLVMIFMLGEATGLPDKLRRAKGDPDADISQFQQVVNQVYSYLHIKAWVSLLTGALAVALVAALRVDYPLLWGLVAFLFNFIPNIGSIIAAVPPVLLALLQHGMGGAVGMAAGYVAINMVVGNVLEPRLMGRRLGLSPLVVVISLILWNWLLGPVGMLLSIPLTTAVKIWLEHTDDGRPIAVMLGPVHAP